jgi:hypothetical protein
MRDSVSVCIAVSDDERHFKAEYAQSAAANHFGVP